MELLIAGSIALVGYTLAEPGRGPRPPRREYAAPLGPANERGWAGNDTSALTRQHRAAAIARWKAARDPAVTGVVDQNARLVADPRMVPFFTRARSQNTNDGIKQTKLETFTGANGLGSSETGTYRSKREVETMFAPSTGAMPLTSMGTAGNAPVNRDLERYDPGTRQNNVLPAEKMYVGRGVGVGPEVAATDGFHPMYRQLLKNVGEYKKNNLPGSVNHGASTVSKTPGQGPTPEMVVNHNAGALEWDMTRRPMMPTVAAVLGQHVAPEPTFTLKRPQAGVEDRFGNPSRADAGHEARGFRETRLGYECGDNRDRNMGLPTLNTAPAVTATGAYTHATPDCFRLHSQQREMPGGSGFLMGPNARQAPRGYVLPPTQRDMSSVAYMGGAGGSANARGGEVHPSDAGKRTMRESQNASVVFGPIAAVKGGTMDNVYRYKRLSRQTKQEPVEGRPMPGRVNVPVGALTGVAMRDDAGAARPASVPTPLNPMYNDAIGQHTTPSNKLPSANPRLDLSVAHDQLRSNPYTHSLMQAARA